jgi:hypothetical protein
MESIVTLSPTTFNIAMRHEVSVLLEYMEIHCLLEILCRVQAQSCSWEAVCFILYSFHTSSNFPVSTFLVYAPPHEPQQWEQGRRSVVGAALTECVYDGMSLVRIRRQRFHRVHGASQRVLVLMADGSLLLPRGSCTKARGPETLIFLGFAGVRSHDLPPSHFFPSSLALGAGSSPVFFSLSHQSFQNFSSSRRFFSLASLSSRLESIVANHSSRAASSSARVAYWFMQLFIAFCCVRHEKVAVKVLLEQQAAKSKGHLSIDCCFVLHCWLATYL